MMGIWKKKPKPKPKAKVKRQPREDFDQAAFRAVQETIAKSESLRGNGTKGATKGYVGFSYLTFCPLRRLGRGFPTFVGPIGLVALKQPTCSVI